MAIFTRVNGDAYGVTNVGVGRSTANATIISTGIATPITAYKITTQNGDLGAESAVGGGVETILRVLAANATVIAYQVDDNNQLSVVTERSAWSDADLKTVLRAQNTGGATAGNVGGYGNCFVGAASTVSSTGGIKLA